MALAWDICPLIGGIGDRAIAFVAELLLIYWHRRPIDDILKAYTSCTVQLTNFIYIVPNSILSPELSHGPLGC